MAKLEPVYAQTAFPDKVQKTIFLAGPTPRDPNSKGWRGEALVLLRQLGFDGHVFIPEAEHGVWNGNYVAQLEWEEEALNRSDILVFWVPRDPSGTVFGTPMPAYTTNIEWGMWQYSGKVVWGAPDWAKHTRYPEYYAGKLGLTINRSLEETLKDAVNRVGQGAERKEGEATIPLYIWQRAEFQAWYTTLVVAGNTLNSARVVFTFPRTSKPFCYTLHANIHIGAENRDKVNEIVYFRSTTSSVLLYHKGETDTKVVLVKEFRSPVANAEGYVYELPGGSSKDSGVPPVQVAVDEVQEETGFKMDKSRLKAVGHRQTLATLSAHHGHLFSYALTDKELKEIEANTDVHGVEGDSERTYVEVKTLKEITEEGLVDWSSFGMIAQGLS